MKFTLHILFFSLLFCNTLLASDGIHWASQLDFQYNQFGEKECSAKAALNKPDALPLGTMHPNAFRLSKQAGFGTLIVSFDEAVPAQHVLVVENYLPGRIADITLYDEKGVKYTVYRSNPTFVEEEYRTLCVAIMRQDLLVKKVELNLNTIVAPGWSQIDAIGISDIHNEEILEQKLNDIGITNFHYSYPFISEKEDLGDNINSEYAEIKPLISPDGSKIYFSRMNHPSNIGGVEDDQDIYYSEFIHGSWTDAKNIGKPLNNYYPNGISAVSPDGNRLLTINRYSDREVGKEGVSVSKLGWEGWNVPQEVKIHEYYNQSSFADFYLSHSGKEMLMSVQRKDGHGDQDLYVSFMLNDQVWSKPVNLGGRINTEKAEFAPFLAADGKTLYFSSVGHKGHGGSDIFFSKRMDDTWKHWTKPRNLGTAVNSTGWDAYYSVPAAGDYAYFVTGKTDDIHSRNIYRIQLPKGWKPEPVLLVKGKVFDSKTELPLEAKIVFEVLGEGKDAGLASSNPMTGDYKIILSRGRQYGYHAQAEGYISINKHIDLENITEYGEITQDLYLIPLEKGQTMTLNNVFFERMKPDILPESHGELERLVSVMKEYPRMEIQLSGHTDNRGLATSKMELSHLRVEAIKTYLTKQGIDKDRIRLKAYGSSRPVASNRYEQTRKLNRRVEVKILKK